MHDTLSQTGARIRAKGFCIGQAGRRPSHLCSEGYQAADNYSDVQVNSGFHYPEQLKNCGHFSSGISRAFVVCPLFGFLCGLCFGKFSAPYGILSPCTFDRASSFLISRLFTLSPFSSHCMRQCRSTSTRLSFQPLFRKNTSVLFTPSRPCLPLSRSSLSPDSKSARYS